MVKRMIFKLALYGGILCLSVALWSQERQPNPPEAQTQSKPITTGVSLVLVNVVVLDQYGFPVSGLAEKDFQILDNGRDQKITAFQETTRPLNTVLLIDSSGSTYKKINLIKQGAIDFVRRIHEARPQDRLAVVNFNDDINLLADFNSSWREKISFIQDRIDAMGGTALYDALYLTTRDILNRTPGRKMVVLYTDGIDNKSLKNFSETLRLVLTSDATFFILTVDNLKQVLADAEQNQFSLSRRQYYEHIQGEAASRTGEVEPQWTSAMRNQFPPAAVLETTYRLSYQRLQRLAENTGGKFFKVASYEELPVIYRQIATELPYYYTLGYQPDFSQATEGEYHTIEVRLKEPGLEARNRRGYYYSKDKTTQ
jgi:VWFA-related protein